MSLLVFLGCVGVSWLGTWLAVISLGSAVAEKTKKSEPKSTQTLW